MRRPRSSLALLAVLPLLFACLARETRPGFENSPRLEAVLEKRLSGDRTGACFAAAVVERDRVERAYLCAEPENQGRIGPRTAFEIGSIAKTMTAALLAQLVLEGKASLDEPLADLLPEGAAVPVYEGQPIRLRHVVTHTSGLPRLPPGMAPPDPADPYASIRIDALLRSLEGVVLETAPGETYLYSNFAPMLLSYALGLRAGLPFETLLRTRLFEPLGMEHAHLGQPPPGIRAAQGHLPSGQPTPAWNFDPDLAGVGGVRATLDDMIAYAQGHLGLLEAPITQALRATHEPLRPEAPKVGMGWHFARTLNGEFLVHEGGTGGFSSFMGIDLAGGRAVVILSDTALMAQGGLGDVGIHLLDPSFPLGKPRS